MKSLKDLTQVKDALSKIAQRSSVQHDNGTFGKKIKCFLYHVEEQHDKNADDLMKIIISKKFQQLDYTQESEALAKLPAPKAMMVFKLIEPMSVKGTKVMFHNNKALSPEIKVLTEIYIPQDIVDQELVGYEETDETETNMMGMETPIIELDLKRCLIDVKEGLRDTVNAGRWKRQPRAYITDIPFRSFQIVGNMLRREQYGNFKAINMMSDDEYANMNDSVI